MASTLGTRPERGLFAVTMKHKDLYVRDGIAPGEIPCVWLGKARINDLAGHTKIAARPCTRCLDDEGKGLHHVLRDYVAELWEIEQFIADRLVRREVIAERVREDQAVARGGAGIPGQFRAVRAVRHRNINPNLAPPDMPPPQPGAMGGLQQWVMDANAFAPIMDEPVRMMEWANDALLPGLNDAEPQQDQDDLPPAPAADQPF